MGVGGNFWDLLKPYAKHEGFDFLRNKKVAVDLSYWIVQHETALKRTFARSPHIRLTFFRTINLFSKFGAFPVFVADGTASPLKSEARIARFFQASGLDLSDSLIAEGDVSVERNRAFTKYVKECVEMLQLLGMPVLKAKGEAEALCAQLNHEGHVDACITADSDAFLFGAKCVIKGIHPLSREPIECYHMSDIEAGLGLKRKHLIAIALLVGSDHDLNGVHGIGPDKALRFVKTFDEESVLNKLSEIGSGDYLQFDGDVQGSDESQPLSRQPHCSFCGHPGSKKVHARASCDYCCTPDGTGCKERPNGFKCDCLSCDMNRLRKEQKKHENWHFKVCTRIASEPNFPNNEIIRMYMSSDNGYSTGNEVPSISWESPNVEMLIDFLAFHQNWEPSYIRQKLLPMLSTIYLREIATDQEDHLLCEQYEFDSIKRVKTRYGHQSFVVKWKKAARAAQGIIHIIDDEEEDDDLQQDEVKEVTEFGDTLEESDILQVHVDNGHWFLLTDENMDLVRAAFPDEVDRFLKEKELKASKRRKGSSSSAEGKQLGSGDSKSVQLSITEFYRSTKVQCKAKPRDEMPRDTDNHGDGLSKEKRKEPSLRLSKSVRRRLLFD